MENVVDILVEEAQVSPTNNYSPYLKLAQLNFQQNGSHYQVGEPQKSCGWILHISVVKAQINELLKLVVPFLSDQNVSFKIPYAEWVSENLLSGAMGYTMLAKIVSIYPETNEQGIRLAKQLLAITQPFSGPAIPTDRHLGGCIYTRYGAFKPIVATNQDGIIERLFYNDNGELLKDEYKIPFRLPVGADWLFEELALAQEKKAGKLINKKYLPIQSLKTDVKGNVIKALDLRKWLKIQWCVIKQGKSFMSADDTGKTIADRLAWQRELQTALSGVIKVPQPFDFFEWNNDTYFIMEYVEGTSLIDLIHATFQGRAWFDLSSPDKLILLDALLQVVDSLAAMHAKGFIHRDIIPNNFLIDKSGKLVCIDLELCYSYTEKKPAPHFRLGTFGYMSPEQSGLSAPEFSQDIFQLGALMIIFFTSMSPVHFDTTGAHRLKDNLLFFIRNEDIAELIVACLSHMPVKRPSLKQIKNIIEQFRQLFIGNADAQLYNESQDKNSSSSIINRSIECFAQRGFKDSNGIWLSRVKPDGVMQNEVTELMVSYGLQEGITGVIYGISAAKLAGFDVERCMPIYNRNLQFLIDYLRSGLPNLPAGLFKGASGIAVSLLQAQKANLIEDEGQNMLLIKQCLLLLNEGLDLSSGIAGQGIACLAYLKFYNDEVIVARLKNIIGILLDKQQKDGSWILPHAGGNKKGGKIYGFSYGAAGIIYMLLEYGRRFNDTHVLGQAQKSLDWLERQAAKEDGKLMWGLHPGNKILSRWFENGYSGISLAFIKAYEVLKIEKYRMIAENALYNLPPHMVSNYQDFFEGITGIGEVYLEAARVFQNMEWQSRAAWIAETLRRSYLKNGEMLYWLNDNSILPMANLMRGNAGMLHFLMRYEKPYKLDFPITA